jgi:hypothetical protein
MKEVLAKTATIKAVRFNGKNVKQIEKAVVAAKGSLEASISVRQEGKEAVKVKEGDYFLFDGSSFSVVPETVFKEKYVSVKISRAKKAKEPKEAPAATQPPKKLLADSKPSKPDKSKK